MPHGRKGLGPALRPLGSNHSFDTKLSQRQPRWTLFSATRDERPVPSGCGGQQPALMAAQRWDTFGQWLRAACPCTGPWEAGLVPECSFFISFSTSFMCLFIFFTKFMISFLFFCFHPIPTVLHTLKICLLFKSICIELFIVLIKSGFV